MFTESQPLQRPGRRFRRSALRRDCNRVKQARRALMFELLEDRRLLTVELASVTPAPPPFTSGEVPSTNPMISANGRYVVFQSESTDLVEGIADANGFVDVFVRDLLLDTTVLISVIPEGGRAGDGASLDPSISDDGRFVAFISTATDLVRGATIDTGPGAANVFVRDRDFDEDGIFDETGPGETVTRLISIATDGTSGNSPSGGFILPFVSSLERRPVISGDGTSVAFASFASDLALDDPTQTDINGFALDVFRASTGGGKLTLLSVNSDATGSCTFVFDTISTNPSISETGGLVAFQSTCDNIVTAASGGVDDTNFAPDIFVGSGGPAALVSINADGDGSGDGGSREPVISRNGRHVAFVSKAPDLVRGMVDANGTGDDVFVRDLKNERTTLVSRSRAVVTPITSGDGDSPPSPTGGEFGGGPAISSTGRFVLFESAATDLLDPAEGIADTNGMPDLFAFDRDPDMDGVFDEPGETRTLLISVNSSGTDSASATGAPCRSFAPSISGNERYVSFASTCEDLIAGISGGNIYVRDLLLGTTALVSETISGGAGGAPAVAGGRATSIDAAGDRVAFISDTLAPDLDPVVTADANGDVVDVFVGTPPTDIRLSRNFATGTTTHTQAFRIFFEDSPPFEVGYYRSTDDRFDAGDDPLGTTTIDDLDDLMVDGNRFFSTTIGTGVDEIALPGIGEADLDEDYFILTVADDTDTVSEFDADPFNEDNTNALRGLYHVIGAEPSPVFVHGRPGGDAITTLSDGTTLTVRYGATGFGVPGTFTYDVADVSEVRVRSHGGDDELTGGDLRDVFFGGEGNDRLDGGAGDDYLDGGPGKDVIIGGPGADTIFDGCGDDLVDVGPDDDVLFSTPCSDDIFIDPSGIDTINFSLDDLEITLDLDSTAVQTVDADLNTIRLVGVWENFVGSPLGNALRARPLPGLPRNLFGGAGNDHLIIDAGGNVVINDGTKLSFPGSGLGDIIYTGFEDLRVINAAARIIDDGDDGYSAPGFTRQFDPLFPQGFNGDIEFSGANDGNTATWTFDDIAPGLYQVAVTWTAAPDRSSSAPFTIRTGDATGPIVREVRVDQERAPSEFDDEGLSWQNLGIVSVTGNQLTVQLTDVDADRDADDPFEFVIADAVRIQTISADQIIDDRDPQFTPGENAARVDGAGAFGGQHSALSLPAQEEGGGLWNEPPGGALQGPYVVSTTWTPNALATQNAAYILNDNTGGRVDVPIDQSTPPDDFVEAGIPWERLGVINIDPAVGFQVEVVGGPGEVLADAVRLDPAPQVRLFESPGSPLPTGGQADLGVTAIDPDTGVAMLAKTFRVMNTGIAPLVLGEPQVTASQEFSVSSLGTNILPPGGFTTFDVTFQANQLGQFSDTIQFNSNDFATPLFAFDVTAEIVQDDTPPTVAIVSPDNGASFIEGTTVMIRVDATDDIGVKQVELLVNNSVVQVDDEFPFEFEVEFLNVGPVTIDATATDFAGINENAGPIFIDVLANDPPTVSIVRPFDGTGVIEGSTIDVQVDAEDDVGVTSVELRLNNTLVETLRVEPFVTRIQLPNGTGDHVLEACATDTFGSVTCQTVSFTSFAPPFIDFNSIVVGADAGGGPHVKVFTANGTETFRITPYPGFLGGVRVATGDITGDGIPDIITAPGPGGGPHVKVFSGATGAEVRSFFAYDGFVGGVNVAVGDVSGDGVDDIITGAGVGGGPHVKVFSGVDNSLLASFFAFQGFTGGVNVAAGDINGDLQDDIIVGATPGGGPHVRVFDGHTGGQIPLAGPIPPRSLLGDFFAFSPGFLGGVFVSAGDIDGNGLADIIVGADADGSTAGGHVKVIDGTKLGSVNPNNQIADRALLADFFAYGLGFTGGVRVAAGDVTGDGTPDIITGAGPGGGPHVKVFDGAGGANPPEVDSFDAFDNFNGAVVVSADVPIVASVVTLPPTGGTYEVNVDGNDLVVIAQPASELFRQPLNDPKPVRINGAKDLNDLLIIRTLGTDSPRLFFDGGLGGNDGIRIDRTPSQTGSMQYLQYTFKSPLITTIKSNRNALAGFSDLTGIDLEPIEDNLLIEEREFVVEMAGDARVRLLDDGDASNNMTTIDANGTGAFETVTFVNPTTSLMIADASGGNASFSLGPRDDGLTSPLVFEGRDGDDTLTIVDSAAFPFAFDGGNDNDSLVLAGSNIHLDLTDPQQTTLRQIDVLDIIGASPNELTLSLQSVLDVTDAANTLTIRHDNDDMVNYGDGWQAELGRIVGSQFYHELTQDAATLLVANQRPWQNPLNRLDVSRNGEFSPVDVAIGIVRLNNLQQGAGPLPDPGVTGVLPEHYVDVSGNNEFSPVDIQIAIVFGLNLGQGGEPEFGNSATLPDQSRLDPGVSRTAAPSTSNSSASLGTASPIFYSDLSEPQRTSRQQHVDSERPRRDVNTVDQGQGANDTIAPGPLRRVDLRTRLWSEWFEQQSDWDRRLDDVLQLLAADQATPSTTHQALAAN